ncbi:MAG: polysaccharide deacetylase family protein [Pseudomonadota bacterium]
MRTSATLAARALASTRLLHLLEAFDGGPGRLRVLTYHRVDELERNRELDPGLLSATPEEFREQLLLLQQHFVPVSLAQVMAALRGVDALPRRAVLLTFDDAYEDFGRVALPMLRAFDTPAVLFVPTAFPDNDRGGFWWDRLYALLQRASAGVTTFPSVGEFDLGHEEGRRSAHKALRNYLKSIPHVDAMQWFERYLEPLADLPSLHRVLGWSALRKLSEHGVDLCPHGHRHALSTRLPANALLEDLQTAKAVMAREVPEACCEVMAYPANDWDEATLPIVAEAGYEFAFAGGRGVASIAGDQRLAIQRIPVLRHHSALFRAQLHPVIAQVARRLDSRHKSARSVAIETRIEPPPS